MSAEPTLHGQAGVTRALRRVADGVEAPPLPGAMKEEAEPEDRRNEKDELGGHDPSQVALAEKEKRGRKARVVLDAAGEPLGRAAEERVGPESDDQGRVAEPGDHDRVQRARRAGPPRA